MALPINLHSLNAVAKAQRLVSQINEDRGFLSDEDLNEIGPPGYGPRRKVEIAMLRKDEIIGSSVLTLAKNLYSSSARFVFELLQNADDNDFSRAIANSEIPHISFRIFPDKVILECNEDGFTSENLRAICAVGRSSKVSSKVGAQGYTGEKGIGFKSVFMVAWQVHIQSNAFSFTFTHRKGDSGIGMISPVWHEPEGNLDGSSTRITLFLHQHDNPDAQEQQYRDIVSQFNELQGTVLLFLRKLQQVRVSFYDKAGNLTSRTHHSLHKTPHVTIRKASLRGDNPEVLEDRLYHVTKHIANNVPPSENKSYADGDHRPDSNTEIVLAFPITDNSVPIVENQDIFAFLPIKKMSFKFLLHTDFVTEASRQNIVTTSRRNRSLRIGIADCFIKAIEQFCQHPTLQFQWMRWLPQRDKYPWDDFWNGLLHEIDMRIITANILRCQTDGQLKTISSLRALDHRHLDEAGNPLFEDLPSAIYLSQEYDKSDLKLLEPYKLSHLSISDIIGILSFDLGHDGDSSRIRSREMDNDWHSRAARLILLCLNGGTSQQRERIRSMKIVPLDTGEWTATIRGPLYYGHCEGGIEIPQGLGLKLVSSVAAANPERRALFDQLGVSTAPIHLVQDKIFSLLKTAFKADVASLRMAVSHLAYLYLTHGQEGGEIALKRFSDYHIYNDRMQVQNPRLYIIYLRTSNQHEPFELLSDGEFQNFFINDAYYTEFPSKSPEETIAWEDWLCQCLGVRRHLRLVHWNRESQQMQVSTEFRHVSSKRPDRIIGALQHSWASQGSIFSQNSALVDEIGAIMVRCENGEMRPLKDTYLPLPELKKSSSRYAEGEPFPFLALPDPIVSGTYQEKWGFLVDVFGVGYSEDFKFYLWLLKVLSRNFYWEDTVQDEFRYLELYQTIQGSCQAYGNRLEAWDVVRNRNEEDNLIFIPAYGTHENTIVGPKDCVWAGQENMQTVYPLESIYRTKFNLGSADLDSLKQYFKRILEIPDCSWEHYVNEIHELVKTEDTDFDWVNKLYTLLDQTRNGILNMDADKLKQDFANKPLIYAPTRDSSCWHTVSQCMWSSTTKIQGRISLNEVYPDLEEFFVDFLGVARLTLDMAYNELKSKGDSVPAPSIQEINANIFALNSLLQARSVSDSSPNPRELLNCKVLPVRYPTVDGQIDVRLTAPSTDFAIVDREFLHEAFASQIKLLDFTLDETRRLRPFIDWLGLSGRYLSVVVKEISTVEYDSRTSRLLQHPNRDVRKRAHGLLRIATHYDSPRTGSLSERVGLYQTLRQTKVYETDSISSELHLSQDGRDFQYVKDTSELHIREDKDGTLEIYVPSDLERQDLCYFETLPPRLGDWLMMDPTTHVKTSDSHEKALNMVNSILNAPLNSVARILVARGIVNVDVPEEDDDSDQGSGSATLSEHEEVHYGQGPGEQGLEEESEGGERMEGIISIAGVSSRHATVSLRHRGHDHTFDPERAIAAAVRSSSYDQTDYVRLLSHVISRARSAIFPYQGTDAPSSEEADGGEDEERRRFYSHVPLERDMKIGAAGELFVFELLSRLINPARPNFNRTNWQSTIRKFVTAHPQYADMEPWNGHETADIVYSDQSRAFTKLLLDRGYLQRDGGTWERKTPTYMIEVKTTTQSANKPFYMSRRQFQRMREHVNPADSPGDSPTIYIVLRVFNVDKDSIGVKVYLDPEKLRRDGLLVFTEHVYSVKPGVG